MEIREGPTQPVGKNVIEVKTEAETKYIEGDYIREVIGMAASGVKLDDWKMRLLGKFKQDLIKMDSFVVKGDRDYWVPAVKKDMESAAKVMNLKLVRDGGEFSLSNQLEGLLTEDVVVPYWLGCDVIKTIDYDDFCRHTDAVLVYKVKGEDGQTRKVFLAADVTLGSGIMSNIHRKEDENGNVLSQLEMKMKRNVADIKNGEKTRVKYFESNLPDFKYKGPLDCIPVVIGIDGDHVKQMEGQDWPINHPVQGQLLSQIYFQLKHYEEVLSGQINKNEEMIKEVEMVMKSLGTILLDKERRRVVSKEKIKGFAKNDSIHIKICRFCVNDKKNPN